jgi:hypothetical protein
VNVVYVVDAPGSVDPPPAPVPVDPPPVTVDPPSVPLDPLPTAVDPLPVPVPVDPPSVPVPVDPTPLPVPVDPSPLPVPVDPPPLPVPVDPVSVPVDVPGLVDVSQASVLEVPDPVEMPKLKAAQVGVVVVLEPGDESDGAIAMRGTVPAICGGAGSLVVVPLVLAELRMAGNPPTGGPTVTEIAGIVKALEEAIGMGAGRARDGWFAPTIPAAITAAVRIFVTIGVAPCPATTLATASPGPAAANPVATAAGSAEATPITHAPVPALARLPAAPAPDTIALPPPTAAPPPTAVPPTAATPPVRAPPHPAVPSVAEAIPLPPLNTD